MTFTAGKADRMLSVLQEKRSSIYATSLVVYMSTTYKLVFNTGRETETVEGGLRHSAFASRTFIPAGRMSCGLQLISCQVVHGASASISSILRISGIPRDDRTTNSSSRSNNLVHSGYVVYVAYVVYLVLISFKHSKEIRDRSFIDYYEYYPFYWYR